MQALTCAAIFAIADALSQRIAGSDAFSLQRCLAVAVWGLVWGGPSQHVWQGLMERLSRRKDMRIILTKVRGVWPVMFLIVLLGVLVAAVLAVP